MKNRTTGKIISYIAMPVLFTFLGYLTLFIGGAPVLSLMKAHLYMIIETGSPDYSNEFNSNLSESGLFTEDSSENERIRIPSQGTHYGNLNCDRIGLEAPIYYGDSEEILEKGAGQYRASGLPGEEKPILIGGHDGTYFKPLENIINGDVISIKTNYGKFEYKVTGTKVTDVFDNTAYDLSETKEQLILYTCYPFGQLTGSKEERFFVYCDRIQDTKAVSKLGGTE
ncbi:sortase [Anaerocolumna sedimenticola]|uniref:Sortase n=1 Tax=Anaerocolumna sedimenticola TaxID=2696063 RepID=A0A6P1TJ74_9FIRM|nr:class D sortase [Anaerocolumna sedimenticola]QHQ59966.1 sortase [Anaerocolumna sedimenticola]